MCESQKSDFLGQPASPRRRGCLSLDQGRRQVLTRGEKVLLPSAKPKSKERQRTRLCHQSFLELSYPYWCDKVDTLPKSIQEVCVPKAGFRANGDFNVRHSVLWLFPNVLLGLHLPCVVVIILLLKLTEINFGGPQTKCTVSLLSWNPFIRMKNLVNFYLFLYFVLICSTLQ